MSHATVLGVVSSLVLLSVSAPAFAHSGTARVDRAVAAMTRAAGAPIAVSRSPLTGLATFLRPARPIPARAAAGRAIAVADLAVAFVAANGDAFGVRNASGLAVRRAGRPDALGIEHVRLQQLHDGVPVTGGEVAVHLRKGGVVAVNARTLSDLDAVGTIPAVDPAAAAWTARALVQSERGVTDATVSPPRLEVFNRGLLEGRPYPTRLAWFVEATALGLRERIWIDAQTGALLLHFSQLADALAREIHDAEDTAALPGTLLRTEGGPPTGDGDADRAYDYASDTYAYFATVLGRDSYDDAGAPLIASVHYCASEPCPTRNAFWTGTQVVFGDGFAADDVVAHEITHAVTEYSAGLFYYMQSGALNESFSDIFGEIVDLTNGRGTDTAATRWHQGEDIVPFGANRNFLVPTAHGDPGRLRDAELACDATRDGGGVHTNSGVPNHAFALMTDGGTYNGRTVSGIGLAKAGAIQYRALTVYLLAASDFRDDYDALNQACADLIGTAGITAGDCTAVTAALDAVEMASAWPCAPVLAPVPALCPAGAPAVELFFDDLENAGSGNWAIQEISGEVHWSYPPHAGGVFPRSGALNLYGDDVGRVGDSAVAMTADVVVPVGARLQFAHAYDFETSEQTSTPYADGGVVEYSVDGGGTWLDAGTLIRAGAAYGGTLADDRENPLADRDAFVGTSYGYTASQLDLGSLAGANVRFRFRIGTDRRVGEPGWFVDDVRIYTCACGDGDLDAGEQCDDGNLVDCDGCDHDCTTSATCGNGTVCGAEACDDGNVVGGDCCSATCQFDASGAACEDGEACTTSDTCDGAGSCVGGGPSAAACDDGNACTTETCAAAVGCVYTAVGCGDGDLCSRDTCDPAIGCANTYAPRSGCRAPRATALRIRDRSPDANDTLSWQWRRGEKTLLSGLGDPNGTTDYALCVYDPTSLLLAVAVPGGGICDEESCWRARGNPTRRYEYRDPGAAADGTKSVQLKTGDTRKAAVDVKGVGAALPDAPLPFTMPVTVQMVNDLGECWSATYTSAPQVNSAAEFRAHER